MFRSKQTEEAPASDAVETSETSAPPKLLPGDLLSVCQVAAVLGVSIRTVYRLSNQYQLPPSVSIGNSRRWLRSTLEEHVRDLERKGAEEQRQGRERMEPSIRTGRIIIDEPAPRPYRRSYQY